MAALASLVFAKADILLALLLYPLLGWVYWRWLRPHLPAAGALSFLLAPRRSAVVAGGFRGDVRAVR